MRTLVYKRTHPGDPDAEGRFGIHDCMGRVRTWSFDAVIGVGGIGDQAASHGLDGKVNWIGIGPHKRPARGKRGPVVTFDHFLFYGVDGPSIAERAPKLAHRLYSRNVRVLMGGVTPQELREIESLLASAKRAPPSSARVSRTRSGPSTPCSPRASRSKSRASC